jgi:hypothetical protein
LAPRAPWQKEGEALRSEEARVGIKVKVGDRHRIVERRGMVGRVVGRYGGGEYVAVEVRCVDGQYRLFWPDDLLEEISPQPSWWSSLLGGGGV